MKKWYQSKTIWTFGILFIVAVLNSLNITNLQLSEDANWLVLLLSFIALALRLITREPIEW